MLRAVLFDFDGTLIDTHQLNILGLNRLSVAGRGRPFSAGELEAALGKPLSFYLQMIRPDLHDTLARVFRMWYVNHHDLYAAPYEGVQAMIARLRACGLKTGIVTNNSRQGLQMGLSLLGLENAFDITITRDDVDRCKPSPDGILLALKALSVSPEAALYVGDSLVDLEAASAAGVLSALVGWTTLTREQRQSHEPCLMLETPDALLDLIEKLIPATA